MADDRTKNDKHDRDRVAAGEDYEVNYLIRKTGISRGQAIGLIDHLATTARRWNGRRRS